MAAALLAISTVPAAQATDWTYRVRPRDNIWDLSSRYLKPGMPWQKLQEYNKVADPYHLPPGMRLQIPVAWLRVQPAKAKVVAVIGSAHAQLPGEAQPLALQPGMQLGYGARLVTGADTSLTLEFADGSRVLMLQDSAMELDRMSAYGRTGMVDTRLRLQHGRVSSTVTPMTGSAAHFSVETPGTTSSVRGTHFRVAADAGAHRSRTEVLTGRIDVSGARRHTLVEKGRGIAVADGARPGRAQPLLPPPALHCPARPIVQVPYQLGWPVLAGASRYRVQVAASERFEALLVDRLSDSAHASLPDLPDGEYAVRVHGIDAQQLEGQDAVCTLRINGHPQPPLVVEPQSGSKVRDTRPRFRWTESEQAVSYAWQLAADAAFTRVLADKPALTGDHVRAPQSLPYGTYYWRIASRDGNGKLGPYSAALPFELVPQPPSPEVGKPSSTRRQLSLGWQAGEPGQRYHVQLDRDPAFAHPAVDQTVDQASLQIPKPGSGTWYVRVQTVEPDGYAGPWGPVQKVRLSCLGCRIAVVGGAAALLWLLL
ncbi:hypothetical protein ASG87_13790 [Frateuria sp. Soil773]|uniref:FecR domain-containing protein n=1 Tax=Frateuria sp. Soil773 TaxID=1736407 RepID=UPI0006F2A260|nr:FecR domain-containing protein [Frateuria sp. Soil773]KRE99477.1 hypothetical protein ASG87_13790 [Frateuria sp. Soil773]